MPALQQEYDYYEYARRRQGAVRDAVPSSAVSKKVAPRGNKTSVSSRSSSKNLNLKTTTTRDVTKRATRMAMDDEFIGVKKSSSSKRTSARKVQSKKTSLDPVVFDKKKSLKKPQEMTLTRPKSNVKAKELEKQKAKVKEMFENVVLASLIFGMLFLICYRYSTINEAFNELNDLKSDVKEKQTINAQIESNIMQNTDLAYIENYAKYQLGMQKPKESQIQKVSVGKQDKILLPIEIKEEEEKSGLDALLEKALELFD